MAGGESRGNGNGNGAGEDEEKPQPVRWRRSREKRGVLVQFGKKYKKCHWPN